MSKDIPPDGLTAGSDPVAVHADEVDAGGLDLATQVHMNARAICDRLGVKCGQQANLPEGLCIATMSPCPFAPEGGSGKPYASEKTREALTRTAAADEAAKKAGGKKW